MKHRLLHPHTLKALCVAPVSPARTGTTSVAGPRAPKRPGQGVPADAPTSPTPGGPTGGVRRCRPAPLGQGHEVTGRVRGCKWGLIWRNAGHEERSPGRTGSRPRQAVHKDRRLRCPDSVPSPVPSRWPKAGLRPVISVNSLRLVPFEMVDAALSATRAVQSRLRDLPSRVVVYLLLAACLFQESGYLAVWRKLHRGTGRPAGRRAHREARWPRPAARSVSATRCGGCSTCCAAPPPASRTTGPLARVCWSSRSTAPT